MASALRPDQLQELKALFDLFDGDGDGLLEVEEVGTIWAACGTVLTEAECLDMVSAVGAAIDPQHTEPTLHSDYTT